MSFRISGNNPTPSNTLHSANLTPHIFAKLALAGAVALALQSAYAENITVNEGDTYSTDITTGSADTVSISGNVVNEKIIVDGSTFHAYEGSNIQTGVFDLYVKNPNNMVFKADSITADEYFVYRGGLGDMQWVGLTSEVKTPWLAVVGTAKQTGFEIRDQKVIDGIQNFWIQTNGARTRIKVSGGLDFTGKTLHFKNTAGTQDAGIEIDNGGALVKFSDIYLEGGKGIIQTDHDGAVSVENLHIAADSTLNLQTWSNDTTGDKKAESRLSG